MGVVRIATIGSSAIAERFVDAVGQVEGVEYVAAYSRALGRARAFGEPHGASLFFDGLDELAASDVVDAVYIASPNGVHADQASLLVHAGKHVLVEKSFAPTEREARRVFDAAHGGGVVALEAARNLHTQGFATIERTLSRLGAVAQASLRFGKVTSRIARSRRLSTLCANIGSSFLINVNQRAIGMHQHVSTCDRCRCATIVRLR
mgnify:CR=1 FL=1